MSPLSTATIDDLIGELKKRVTSMVFAAYYKDDGDGSDFQSFGLTCSGFAHERAGLARLLSLRIDRDLHKMASSGEGD